MTTLAIILWASIGDSFTWQPGFADAVCDEKLGIVGATTELWAQRDLSDVPHKWGVRVLLGANDARDRVPSAQYRANMEVLVA